MSEWETVKRARLDLSQDQDMNTITSQQQQQQLPFSTFLSNSFRHNEKHPILSDKKLIVYDLKVERPDLPIDYEENAWGRLKLAIHAIQRNEPSPESLEVLYQLCENLCQYDKAQRLYDLLYIECSQYVEIQFQGLSNNTEQGIDYLRLVYSLWKNYCDQMSDIRCLFLYLDRTFILTTSIGSLWNMAMSLFRDNYIKYDEVWKKVLNCILELIKFERQEKEKVDVQFLQLNIKMLIELNLYQTIFEQHLLSETKLFYSQEGDELIEKINIFDYLQHISIRVHQESIIRIKNYFDKSTKSYLQSIVEKELLTKRVQVILDKCFDYFKRVDEFNDNDYDKFSLLYRLLQKVDKLDICSKYFTNYIKLKGSSILCNTITNTQEKIKLLSLFESQTDEIVDHSFEGDEQFVDGLKDGTEYFINTRSNNAIKLLTKYLDNILQSTTIVDEDMLEKGLYIFRHLQLKDEFEVIYKRDLAKRLLLNISNKSCEKTILAKMKKECGPGYTGKLEGMIKDIEKSEVLMTEFNTMYANMELPLDLNVNLLTHGFWPSYTPITFNLPPMFQQLQTIYTDFYMQKFEKRILTWQNSLSVCKVNASYPLGTKQITLTLLQTIVLLLFNYTGQSWLSFNDILTRTQLDEIELRRTLVSLCCRDYKLLKKYPEGDDIESTDGFTFNIEFETEKTSLKMTTATLSEVIEKNSTMNTTVLFAREQQIDAVMVRIMKQKTTASHGLLLSEVTRLVKFPVTAQDVKKRIEILIDKEYLERGPDDSYTYLA